MQKKRIVLLSISLAWPAVAGCSRAETFSQLSPISFAQPCTLNKVQTSELRFIFKQFAACVTFMVSSYSTDYSCLLELPRNIKRTEAFLGLWRSSVTEARLRFGSSCAHIARGKLPPKHFLFFPCDQVWVRCAHWEIRNTQHNTFEDSVTGWEMIRLLIFLLAAGFGDTRNSSNSSLPIWLRPHP